MKRTALAICALAAIALAAFYAVPVLAEGNVSWEAGLGGNYTNNLLSEASGIDDSYSNSRAALYWYPFSTLRTSISGDYTYYGNTWDLSNASGAVGISWIPTPAQARFSMYTEGSYDTRAYRERFKEFDNRNAKVKAGAGYELTPWIRVRSGLSGRITTYPNADTTTDSDYRQTELFAGINASFPLALSLDIEGGMGVTGYSYINASKDSVLPQFANPADYLTDGDFNSLYISPRLSRSIGQKTGLSLTYTYREFREVDAAVVPGYTTDFLSPWAAFFEGSSVALQVKTFVVPHFVITAGVGYWDKTYLRTLELITEMIEPYPGAPLTEMTRYEDPKDAGSRQDDLSRVYLAIQRPIRIVGIFCEPSLSIDYSDNDSSNEDYDYSSTAVGLSLTFRP